MKKTKKELEEELKALNASQAEVKKQLAIYNNEELRLKRVASLKKLKALKEGGVLEYIDHAYDKRADRCSDDHPYNDHFCPKCMLLQEILRLDQNTKLDYSAGTWNDKQHGTDLDLKIEISVNKFPPYE